MRDAEMAARLQAVLDEVCANLAPTEAGKRERVAAKLRDAVREDGCSLEDLRRAGRDALTHAPTMWR